MRGCINRLPAVITWLSIDKTMSGKNLGMNGVYLKVGLRRNMSIVGV
jgi:hypothetical protein